MADVFVSYAREDRGAVGSRSWTSWNGRPGPCSGTATYRPARPGGAISGRPSSRPGAWWSAWTEHSILSDWVAEEADEARARDILAFRSCPRNPVPPSAWPRGVQAADLTGWPRQLDPRVSEAFLVGRRQSWWAASPPVRSPIRQT